MEQDRHLKEIHTEKENEKRNSIWNLFWKNNLIYCIIGAVSFVCFLIIFFLLKDFTYLWISIAVPALMALWVGLDAVRYFIKKKQTEKKEVDQDAKEI